MLGPKRDLRTMVVVCDVNVLCDVDMIMCGVDVIVCNVDVMDMMLMLCVMLM